MKNCDEASRALLVKMLITLEPRYAFGSNFEYFFLLFFYSIFLFYVLLFFLLFFFLFFFFFFFCFFSFFFFGLFIAFFVYFFVEYLCSLTLSSYWYAKQWRGFTEHYFGRSSFFNENVQIL